MGQIFWEEFKKYHGKWWSPDEPELVFPGVLGFDKGRPGLSIKAPYVGQEFYALGKPETIHGELQSGEKVTLWDLQGSHLHYLSTRKSHTKYRRLFSCAILGDYLASPKEQIFKFSSYGLRGLPEFSERLDAVPASLPEAERPKYEDARFSIEHNETCYQISARIENPRQLQRDEAGDRSYFPYRSGDEVRITFQCSPPAPLEVHDELLRDFRGLLAFACIDIIPIEGQWLGLSERIDMYSVVRRDSLRDFRKYATGNIFNFNMLVTLDQVPPEILLPRWWKAAGDLYPATEIISSYNLGIRGVLESSTSSAIALAERLQEAIAPGAKRYERAAYREMQAKIMDGFSDDIEFAALLKGLLNNRLTLQGKLDLLAEAVSPERFTMMGIDSVMWMKDVRAVRDLLAHTGSHVKGRSSGAATKLIRVNYETRAIVSILILKLMDLEENVLNRAAESIGTRRRIFFGS